MPNYSLDTYYAKNYFEHNLSGPSCIVTNTPYTRELSGNSSPYTKQISCKFAYNPQATEVFYTIFELHLRCIQLILFAISSVLLLVTTLRKGGEIIEIKSFGN